MSYRKEHSEVLTGTVDYREVAPQLDGYLARLGLSRGVLVIFDARAVAEPAEDRTRFEEALTASGGR